MRKKLIVFTIDDNYVAPFCVAIASLLRYNDITKFKIGLVYSRISIVNLYKIRKYFGTIGLELIEKKIKSQFENIPVSYHFNNVIFYRLLIPQLFSDEEKVLYLDSDMLFFGDVEPIFYIPLLENNNVLAAVPKTTVSGVPNHMKEKVDRYFASGLLLINIKEFLNERVLEKVEIFLEHEEFDMPDQDALNSVVSNWVEVDLKYGVETSFLKKKEVEGFEFLQPILEDPVIVQFSGRWKPWSYKCKHLYKKQYWEYLKTTPFKRLFPVDMPFKVKVKIILSKIYSFVRK